MLAANFAISDTQFERYTKSMRYFIVILSALTSLLAVIAWISARHVDMTSLTIYDIFPLFGLIAFTLMWAQIVGGAVLKFYGIKAKSPKHVSALISGLILSLIVLHPLTLWTALFIDGAGLPPTSYLSTYGVSDVATVALLFGSVSLAIFLSYELRRWFSRAPWWRYILWLQSLALSLIFFHALILGREAGRSWFTFIWILYGITLAATLLYNHKNNRRKVHEK